MSLFELEILICFAERTYSRKINPNSGKFLFGFEPFCLLTVQPVLDSISFEQCLTV